MAETAPLRSRDYVGPVTNTDRWDGFQFRSGDIVISTPPKSGTTWSQAILMMLIHGKAVADRAVWRDSLWLDCAFRDRAEAEARLGAQAHRRCIKSHTPLDGIKYDAGVVYIAVYRHPIDVHFSLKRHVANMKNDSLDFIYAGTSDQAFGRFLTWPATEMGTDDLTLAALVHHFQSFRKWSCLPNVHFFHYADLSADPMGQIRRFAEATGLPVDETLVAAIASATGIGTMREVARGDTRSDKDSAFHDETKFFDTGTSSKWKGRLNMDQIAAYKACIADMLPGDDRRWLEEGGPFPE